MVVRVGDAADMAKRNLFWHIGPAELGTVALPQALELASDDFNTITAAEARDADLDLRWAHKAAGRKRASVEGAWSRLESKVWHGRGTWLISTPGIHLASDDQRRLAMDGLRGVKVRFVVFRTPTNGAVVDEILTRWTQPLHPERVLVLDTDGTTQGNWRALLAAAEMPEQPLPESIDVVDPGHSAEGLLTRAIEQEPGRPDVHAVTASLLADASYAGDDTSAASRALTSAADRIAALAAEVARLQAENDQLDRKRRKHKKRAKALAAERDQLLDAPDDDEAA